MINSHYPRCVRLFWNENTKSRKSLKTEDHVSINETQAFGNPSAVWALRQAMRDMSWKVGSRWFEQFILGNRLWMFPKTGVPPKSSNLIGFSIIFTIHFGGNTPIFGNTQIGWFEDCLAELQKVILDCPFQPPVFWAQVPSPCLNPLLQWTLWYVLQLGVRLETKLPTGFSKKTLRPCVFWDALAFGILVRLISTLEGHSKMYQWWYMQCYKKKF